MVVSPRLHVDNPLHTHVVVLFEVEDLEVERQVQTLVQLRREGVRPGAQRFEALEQILQGSELHGFGGLAGLQRSHALENRGYEAVDSFARRLGNLPAEQLLRSFQQSLTVAGLAFVNLGKLGVFDLEGLLQSLDGVEQLFVLVSEDNL